MTRVKVDRALVSVHDKSGIVEFARRLVAAGVEIVSSGGTRGTLADAGIEVTSVEEVTGAAEMLGGRVKTLHPNIHGAILADLSDRHHQDDLRERQISPFQLVVVSLYPFERTVAKLDVSHAEAIEQIDIGGPTMIRAAAKNHAWVGVVTHPAQYEAVADAVESGGLDGEFRRRLAQEAFFCTAAYDAAIVKWMEGDEPERLVKAYRRHSILRYGENPHQRAAAYREATGGSWWTLARHLQGKEMSFNNYLDTEAAWRLANAFDRPAAVVVKHTNPCGVATGAEPGRNVFEAAWECDPLSAFGGVIALNHLLDEATARAIAERFVEVVIAPDVAEPAAAVLASKANLRVLVAPAPRPDGEDLRPMEGGVLSQSLDRVADEQWEVVSERPPSIAEERDLRFAWQVAASTKSNAIVVARDGAAVGIGAGDQSRVGAARRAITQAGDRSRGAVAASDAFFPFADGVEALAAAGIAAVVEPGGSRNDDEVIAAADAAGMAMVFTGSRHFRH